MTRTRQQGENTFHPAPAPAFPTSPAQARGTPTLQPAPNLTPVQLTCNTMDGVAATAPNPSVPGFPGIFNLLEERANTTPQLRIHRLVTLQLGERPPLVVFHKVPEIHIRVLWGAQFVTQSFAQPTLQDGKILAFVRGI